MDNFTIKHLENWLTEKVGDDIRDMVRMLMVETYLKDAEFWANKGWRDLYSEVSGRIQYQAVR